MMTQEKIPWKDPNLDFGRKFAFSRSYKFFSAYLLREPQYTKDSFQHMNPKDHTFAENNFISHYLTNDLKKNKPKSCRLVTEDYQHLFIE